MTAATAAMMLRFMGSSAETSVDGRGDVVWTLNEALADGAACGRCWSGTVACGIGLEGMTFAVSFLAPGLTATGATPTGVGTADAGGFATAACGISDGATGAAGIARPGAEGAAGRGIPGALGGAGGLRPPGRTGGRRPDGGLRPDGGARGAGAIRADSLPGTGLGGRWIIAVSRGVEVSG